MLENISIVKMVESPRPNVYINTGNFEASLTMILLQEDEYEHLERCDPPPCHPMATCTPGFGAVACKCRFYLLSLVKERREKFTLESRGHVFALFSVYIRINS